MSVREVSQNAKSLQEKLAIKRQIAALTGPIRGEI